MKFKTLVHKWVLTTAGLTLLVLATFVPAEAFQTKLGDEASLDVDVQLAYRAGWRVKDQDSKLLADINGDDGNRNFDQWDMMNNRFNATIDIDLSYKNVGLFARPRAYFDFVYDGSNANDSLTNNNGPQFGGPLSASDEFSSETEDLHRDKAEILDLFAYSNFDLGGHNLMLRVGRQVVSWGESLFIPNGISSAQSPVDATAANVPGVELKEIFLPVGQASAQVDLVKNVTLGGFYQWEWDKTRLDEQGAYFSHTDFLDDAGRRIIAPTPPPLVPVLGPFMSAVDKIADDNPSDDGQWGVTLRYLAEWLNDTEFGLYYINSHEKTPAIEFGGFSPAFPGGPIVPHTYQLTYAEDVELYGTSFSSVIGATNVSGEVSYRQDVPIPVNGPPEVADVVQAQISAIHLLTETPLWDSCTLMGEVGVNRVSGYGSADLMNDRSAWGGTVKMIPEYFQILQGLDLQVPVTYKVNPNGVSSILGTFAEDNDSLAVGLDFNYMQVYKAGISYTEYLHSGDKNPLADRDILAVNLSYTF